MRKRKASTPRQPSIAAQEVADADLEQAQGGGAAKPASITDGTSNTVGILPYIEQDNLFKR